VTQIDRVVEAVEETLKGHCVTLLAKKELPRLDLPKVGGGAGSDLTQAALGSGLCTCLAALAWFVLPL
jgi:threonylcarbamoyladenosine tRNA methylthiotransferase CDKAL1